MMAQISNPPDCATFTKQEKGRTSEPALVQNSLESFEHVDPSQMFIGPDRWFYPPEISKDLDQVGLPDRVVAETLNSAWEYARCVVPQFTNWNRYIAFTRLLVVAVIAEFNGSLLGTASEEKLLGYDTTHLLNTLFEGTPAHNAMALEYRAFILFTAEKSSGRCDSKLFLRYRIALAESPETWFRLRDCDALIRFTIAASLACNDIDDLWLQENELRVLGELGSTLYDAVAFHKHLAEGEYNSTFSYFGHEMRAAAFKNCREVLWALEVLWAQSPAHRCILNFLRLFGGPLHLAMRRYRFVENGLILGHTEPREAVEQARKKVKLWNLVEATTPMDHAGNWPDILQKFQKCMFPGMLGILEACVYVRCGQCRARNPLNVEVTEGFQGLQLCESCKTGWGKYLVDFPGRAVSAFPSLKVDIGERDSL